MKNFFNKLTLITALTLVLTGLTPVGDMGVVQAASTVTVIDQNGAQVEMPLSGKCGDKANWKYDQKTKTLTISGKGKMYDYADMSDYLLEYTVFYDYSQAAPYYYWGKYATKIVIKKGITGIGNWNFNSFWKTTTIELPNTLKTIGDYCFKSCSELKSIEIPDSVTTIGHDTLFGCDKLSDILVGKGLKSIGENSIAFYATEGKSRAVKITINSTKLKNVGKAALYTYRYKTSTATIYLAKNKYSIYKKLLSNAFNSYENNLYENNLELLKVYEDAIVYTPDNWTDRIKFKKK